MRIFPASLAAACLSDGGGDGELCQFILKGVRDDGVESGAEVHKIGSLHKSLVCPDVGGCSAIPC